MTTKLTTFCKNETCSDFEQDFDDQEVELMTYGNSADYEWVCPTCGEESSHYLYMPRGYWIGKDE